jgi:DNA polymerase-3 subunit epsilon
MEKRQSPVIRDKMIVWAKEVLDHKNNYVILDTETTGLNKNDVVIQIAIIDLNGNEILNSLVKPTKRKRMSTEATAIHGITMSGLANAPTFAELKPEIDRITSGKTVLIYNAEFDERLIDQSTSQDLCFSPHFKTQCVMKNYSFFVQQWSDYHGDWSYQKLPSGDHSAIGDCQATLKVIQKMAQAELTLPLPKPVTVNPPPMAIPQAVIVVKTKKWWQIWK